MYLIFFSHKGAGATVCKNRPQSFISHFPCFLFYFLLRLRKAANATKTRKRNGESSWTVSLHEPFRSTAALQQCESKLTAVMLVNSATEHNSGASSSLEQCRERMQLIWAGNSHHLTLSLQPNNSWTPRIYCSTLTVFKRYSYNWVVNRYGRKFWLRSWVTNNCKIIKRRNINYKIYKSQKSCKGDF